MANTLASWVPAFGMLAYVGFFLFVWWLATEKFHAQPRVYWGWHGGGARHAGGSRPVHIRFRWVALFMVVVGVLAALALAPIW